MLNLDELLKASDATRLRAQCKPTAVPEPTPKEKPFLDTIPGVLLLVVMAGFGSESKVEVDPYEDPFSPGFGCRMENIVEGRSFLEQVGEQMMSPFARMWG